MLKRLVSVLLFMMCILTDTQAQELNCKVKILSTAITNTDKQIFATMEKAVSDFMMTRKWTTDEYTVNEKIDVNILINLTAKNGEDIYNGTITVQASRPVFNAGYTSSIMNYMDKDVVIRYSQFTPL